MFYLPHHVMTWSDCNCWYQWEELRLKCQIYQNNTYPFVKWWSICIFRFHASLKCICPGHQMNVPWRLDGRHGNWFVTYYRELQAIVFFGTQFLPIWPCCLANCNWDVKILTSWPWHFARSCDNTIDKSMSVQAMAWRNPEAMLTQIYVAIWRHLGDSEFIADHNQRLLCILFTLDSPIRALDSYFTKDYITDNDIKWMPSFSQITRIALACIQ